ncbi:MAG: FHA domain-containing protein [Planctomycetes bacterium]|nr:FHA domain-containing protein [Planctomycetota bacterium]
MNKAPSQHPVGIAVKSQGYPQLVAVSEGANILLDKPITLIGRHQECDIQIPSRKVSRRHCCIALLSDHLVVRDLGSTNGIRINGIKVVEGNLQPNDELTIGNMRYQVSWGNGDLAHAVKASAPLDRPAPPLDESFEQPRPLPDDPVSIPILASEAKAPSKAPIADPAKPLEIPDNIGLAPLDNSPKS